MKKLLIGALGTLLTTAVSFNSLANTASYPATVAQSGSPVTICYYEPSRWMGPSQRGYSIVLEGHVVCEQERGYSRLAHFKHVYQ